MGVCYNVEMKQHPLYTDYYITEEGEVWSSINNIFLKPFSTTDGHIDYNLYHEGKQYKRRAHRLVMETYNPIENMEQYIVHHINHVEDDNRLENLQWMTPSDHHRLHKTGKVFSEETRKKIGDIGRGRWWWNNGVENKRGYDCPGEGWVRGQLGMPEEINQHLAEVRKGMLWWNNGVDVKRSRECPGEGWVRGRTV